MIFKEGTALYYNEVVREAGQDVMYINYIGALTVPSLEDAECMARTINALTENPSASKIIFVQHRNYVHDFEQVNLLLEIAQLYTYFTKQEKLLSIAKIAPYKCKEHLSTHFNALRYLLETLLKQDPIGCYFEAKRFLREERINMKRTEEKHKSCSRHYARLLSTIANKLESTKLISMLELKTFHVGDRSIYARIFRADIIPNFTFTRLMARIPSQAKLVDEYEIGKGEDKSRVTIMKIPEQTSYFYHLTPPEFVLEEEFYELMYLARNVLIEHKPKAEEFLDPQRTRNVFFNISRDLIQEIAGTKKIRISYEQLNKLAKILVRHTIGFGVIEILLQDENIQDIVINSPANQQPIFLKHQNYGECTTNIIPSLEDVDSWAAKFRMLSGRPLDEANPVLDTDLFLEGTRARIAVIQQPLSPYGLAYAIRRHREMPWTLPLFIKNRMLDPLAAGLLSFLIDGARTLLIAGTRSSGKTSLLCSLMLEIMPKNRIIVLEDVLEMPVDPLRALGYDILRMKVRSALLKETTEMGADEGIRTSLRLGDSCLIVGEVRSVEALALYEAMRIGALANVVAGTIHGASPYGVFDRVVNDLKVPITSFKATDCIVICNPIKSPDGLHSWKRVVQISEVRKHWQNDPLVEGGFVDLMNYNVKKDILEATADLINGDSEIIKAIAANVKGWAGNWDAVYDNILLRAKIKEEIMNAAAKTKMLQILEAPFVVKSNNVFHEISDDITREIGVPEGKRVFEKWDEWLKSEIKKMKK